MSGLPTPCYHVSQELNAGWPTGRESYGHGVPIVVSARESRVHGEGEQVTRYQYLEVREMRNAETVLGIIHDRGQRGQPIEDVYRQLYNPDLFLRAYGRIYRNEGAMTRGTTEETVDGMSRKKIESIIEDLRYERYRWTPVRRTYIPKKNGKQRPLGLPVWSDKLVQEVVRSILEAYFEPQFSDHSHGFRPNRGCHTALQTIQKWSGVNWFIEGDIEGCYDNIDHEGMLSRLREHIHDNRFIRLLANLFKAGYLEDWTYHPTLSGVPQGGIVSPILSNIYLARLDRFVEHELIPRFTQGSSRKRNPQYSMLCQKIRDRSRKRDVKAVKELRKIRQQIPSVDTTDADFRRLYYARYADDFLLGFSGPKREAEQIKEILKEFLHQELKLKLSEGKTLITHASTEAARFLGYDIRRELCNTRHDRQGRRCINHRITLRVPQDVVRERCNLYKTKGKIAAQGHLIENHDFTIVSQYQGQYRGFVQYYALASNIARLQHLEWTMLTSLLHTLARKHRTRVNDIVKRYKSTVQTPEGPRRCFEVKVEREGKKPLVARFGGIPLKRQRWAEIKDQPKTLHFESSHTELVQRLLADQCEICGSTDNCQVHHVRKLADLKVKGRKARPQWKTLMATRRRKTLVVCKGCHVAIHAGKVGLNAPSDG